MAANLPHGTVTVLMSDVEGSTGIAGARGDPSAHELMRVQREIVRRQIAAHHGREIKTMGDGFLVAFDSGRAGVACATAIQRGLDEHNRRNPGRQLRVRIGLNTGDVILEEGDLFGNTVAAAERIMKKARGGEILISDALRAVLGAASDLRLRERGRTRMKGFEGRWRLYEVLWRDEASDIASGADRTPFVARTQERARLVEAIERAAAGRGSLVLIDGEPGVGKTRLAQAAMAEARRHGMLALSGQCQEEGTPPYTPFAEMLTAAARIVPHDAIREALGNAAADVVRLMPALRDVIPGMPPSNATGDASDQHHLFDAVTECVSRNARTQPMVLLLDDLQWADDATLQLLQHITRHLHEMAVLVIVAFRAVERGAVTPLARALGNLYQRPDAQHIDLRRFDEEGVRAMLAALAGREPPEPVAAAFLATTEGNAFFIEEVYRHLLQEGRLFDAQGTWLAPDAGGAELSQSLRFVIERRFARVSEDARRVLQAGAIAGRAFTVELVESISEVRGDALFDALDEAEREQLIVEEGRGEDVRFAFAHGLFRHALIDGLGPGGRRRLHLRAARAIESTAGRQSQQGIADLAYHYRAAGGLADSGTVIAALREAADSAMRVCAPADAEEHYRTALKMIGERSDASDRVAAPLLHGLAQAQYRLGRFDDAERTLDAALERYRSLGDGERAAEVLYAKAVVCTFRAEASRALEHLDAAMEVPRIGDRLGALCLVLQSQNLVQLRRFDEAAKALDKAAMMATRVGDTYVTVRVAIASGYLGLSTLDLRRADREFSRVLATEEIGMHERMASMSRRGLALAGLGRLDDAVGCAVPAEAFFRRIDDPFEHGMAVIPLGIAAMARGFDDVSQLVLDAIESSGTPPSPWVSSTLMPLLLQARMLPGKYDEVTGVLARERGRAGALARSCAALWLAARGEPAEPSAIPPGPPGARAPGMGTLPLYILEAETAVMLRDADLAGAHFDALSELYERGVLFSPGWVALLPRLLGAIAVLRGEPDAAERLLRHALEIASRTGAAVELALTHLELAELYQWRDETGTAREHLREGRRLAEGSGAHLFERRFVDVGAALDTGGEGPNRGT